MSIEENGTSNVVTGFESGTPLDSILEQPLDPANLIFDLNDLLRRDPTLSSLSNNTLKQKELCVNPNQVQAQLSSETGVPIPKRMNDELNNLDEIFNRTPENDRVPNLLNNSNLDSSGTQTFGSSYSSGFEASPLGPTSPWDKSIVKMEMEMSMDMGNQGIFYDENKHQPTLAQLNSPPLETEFNSELNWDSFFTNDEARNVTLSQTIKPSIKSAFSQSIKAEIPSETLLSSSVPAQPHNGNSPLSDIILPELNPTSPGNIIAVSPSVIGGGPPPRSASFSGQRPVIMGPGKAPSHAGPERVSTLHKLLQAQNRPSPVRSPESRNNKTLIQMKSSLLSASNPLLSQQLSKSAPSQHTYLERLMWTRREPRPHINSVCSVGGESSITDEVNEVLNGLSPTDLPDIASDDEDPDQDTEEKNMENEDDSSNDDITDDEESPDKFQSNSKTDSKKERHFWQYNVQAKGPKGQKIALETKIDDPHELNEIVDPVFAGDVKLQGIKHSGKARRGDGNDLTSNPKKLASIGKELEQLSKVINDLTPVSEMPFAARCKSRKEKNKLASRACRLKKKAQHEANKLKCCGLRDEHQMLIGFINRSKEIIKSKVDPNNLTPQNELTSEIDQMVKKAGKQKVAGSTTEYVNKQIERYLS